jgi:hypothetical protein
MRCLKVTKVNAAITEHPVLTATVVSVLILLSGGALALLLHGEVRVRWVWAAGAWLVTWSVARSAPSHDDG